MMSSNSKREDDFRIAYEKAKIRKKIEREVRAWARTLMILFAFGVMMMGAMLSPPTTVIGMIAIICFCFLVVPLLTMAIIYAVIVYLVEQAWEERQLLKEISEK